MQPAKTMETKAVAEDNHRRSNVGSTAAFTAASGSFVSHSPLGLQGHSRNWGLANSILLGDAFHNFCDGIFIGNAFKLCDRSLGYTIVITTIYHEIAQEIADYVLLTHHCGLSRALALGLNFLSGFSVMLGAIIILSLDLSEEATGFILAMSAGVYLNIAASECIPRVMAFHRVPMDKLWFLLCFAIGSIPIGLVLLNHGHCEAGEHHNSHDDHASHDDDHDDHDGHDHFRYLLSSFLSF